MTNDSTRRKKNPLKVKQSSALVSAISSNQRKYLISDTTFLACQTSKSCFSTGQRQLKKQLLEQTKCCDVKHLTSKSEYLVKMIGEHLTGQKEWHPSSKQAHFPQPPKQTVVIIAKETKKVFFDSLEPNMEEVSNILTAAMDKEEQNSG